MKSKRRESAILGRTRWMEYKRRRRRENERKETDGNREMGEGEQMEEGMKRCREEMKMTNNIQEMEIENNMRFWRTNLLKAEYKMTYIQLFITLLLLCYCRNYMQLS